MPRIPRQKRKKLGSGGEFRYVEPINIVNPKAPKQYPIYKAPRDPNAMYRNAAKGTAEPMVGMDDPIFNAALLGYGYATAPVRSFNKHIVPKDKTLGNRVGTVEEVTRIKNSDEYLESRYLQRLDDPYTVQAEEELAAGTTDVPSFNSQLNRLKLRAEHGRLRQNLRPKEVMTNKEFEEAAQRMNDYRELFKKYEKAVRKDENPGEMIFNALSGRNRTEEIRADFENLYPNMRRPKFRPPLDKDYIQNLNTFITKTERKTSPAKIAQLDSKNFDKFPHELQNYTQGAPTPWSIRDPYSYLSEFRGSPDINLSFEQINKLLPDEAARLAKTNSDRLKKEAFERALGGNKYTGKDAYKTISPYGYGGRVKYGNGGNVEPFVTSDPKEYASKRAAYMDSSKTALRYYNFTESAKKRLRNDIQLMDSLLENILNPAEKATLFGIQAKNGRFSYKPEYSQTFIPYHEINNDFKAAQKSKFGAASVVAKSALKGSGYEDAFNWHEPLSKQKNNLPTGYDIIGDPRYQSEFRLGVANARDLLKDGRTPKSYKNYLQKVLKSYDGSTPYLHVNVKDYLNNATGVNNFQFSDEDLYSVYPKYEFPKQEVVFKPNTTFEQPIKSVIPKVIKPRTKQSASKRVVQDTVFVPSVQPKVSIESTNPKDTVIELGRSTAGNDGKRLYRKGNQSISEQEFNKLKQMYPNNKIVEYGFGGTIGNILSNGAGLLNLIPGIGQATAPIVSMAGNALAQVDGKQKFDPMQMAMSGLSAFSPIPVKHADGGEVQLAPINIEGHNVSSTSMANSSKGELLVKDGRIHKNYISRPPHPEFGMDPRGNDEQLEGMIVIPKNRTKEYLHSDMRTRKAIERSLISRQAYRDRLASRMLEFRKPKMSQGGRVPGTQDGRVVTNMFGDGGINTADENYQTSLIEGSYNDYMRAARNTALGIGLPGTTPDVYSNYYMGDIYNNAQASQRSGTQPAQFNPRFNPGRARLNYNLNAPALKSTDPNSIAGLRQTNDPFAPPKLRPQTDGSTSYSGKYGKGSGSCWGDSCLDKANRITTAMGLPVLASDAMDMFSKVETYDPTLLKHINGKYIDENTGYRNVQNAFAAGRYNLRDSGMLSRRGMIGMASKEADSQANRLIGIRNQNAGISNQISDMNSEIDKYNAQVSDQAKQFYLQGKANRRLARRKFGEDLFNLGQTYFSNRLYSLALPK